MFIKRDAFVGICDFIYNMSQIWESYKYYTYFLLWSHSICSYDEQTLLRLTVILENKNTDSKQSHWKKIGRRFVIYNYLFPLASNTINLKIKL